MPSLPRADMRKLILLLTILFIFLAAWSSLFDKFGKPNQIVREKEAVKVLTEESVVIDVVKKVGPSVVTIAQESPGSSVLSPFSVFEIPTQSQTEETVSIGSGFIVSENGFIVTSKHVALKTGISYLVITANDKKYTVEKVFRDPLNDIAILKIDPGQNPGEKLKPVTLGDSSKLQVGQFVIAIGTALGEFRNTVTTGVISGLGRGIVASDQFQGLVERLDNVIQTDAAINPGNSGGPLVNSASQVIGVNTAVSRGGQNIGFALPINVVKEALDNFNQHGQFERPFLGVAYKMIGRETAILNDVAPGAFVEAVVRGSPADKAGFRRGDIITEIDGQKLEEGKEDLGKIIVKHKVGDVITLTILRDRKTQTFKAMLGAVPQE